MRPLNISQKPNNKKDDVNEVLWVSKHIEKVKKFVNWRLGMFVYKQ